MLLILAMSLPGAVRALGLGDIRIDSALNEPLSAQIDIVGATRDELAGLTAKVAAKDVFLHHGAERPGFLSTASFKVGLDARGRPVLNVRSIEPFTDPVVSFLVDLQWNSGELIREYSLLLDPPGFADRRPLDTTAVTATSTAAPAAAPTAVAPSAAPPVARASSPGASSAGAPSEKRRIRNVDADQTSVAAAGTWRRVGPHDTLGGIVHHAGANSESQAERMMIAIYRANPRAFDGNINRLRLNAMLSLPTAADVEAVDASDARREVRAQMAAWRQDGHSGSARRSAAKPLATPAPTHLADAAPTHLAGAAPVDSAPTIALQNRVQSLEAELDEVHKQLASEHATIQDLKQVAAAKPEPAAASKPEPVVATKPEPAPAAKPDAAAASKPEQVAAPKPDQPGAINTDASSPVATKPPVGVSVEVMHAAQPKTNPALAQAAAPAVQRSGFNVAVGSLAAAVALALGGIAYFRRRRQQPILRPLPEGSYPNFEPRHRPLLVAESALTGAESSNVMPVEARKIVPPAMQGTDLTPTRSANLASREAPQEVNIDPAALEEALERSYLDALAIDDINADTGKNRLHGEDEAATHDSDDNDTSELATLDTVSLDATQLAAADDSSDIHTAIIEAPAIDMTSAVNAASTMSPAPAGRSAVDYDLLDLDATAEHIQHVQMPSQLHDQALVSERRMNIVDVLKAAIERDPNRRDLKMKLLETYYGSASTNRRAFLDEVKKMSKEDDKLTADDWKRINLMGREIAPDDIFFADADKGDIADCA